MILDRLKELFGVTKTPEERRVIGAEARQLLENRHFKEAFEAVELQLFNKALSVDPNDLTACQTAIISMQNLQGVMREIHRKVQDADLARAQIEEKRKEEERRANLRMVR